MGATLIATLVLGIGAGVLMDRLVLLPGTAVPAEADAGAQRSDHDQRRQRFRDRLRDELHLTPEQQTKLAEVLDKNHDVAERFWQDSRRQYEDLRKTFRQDIRALLTDEQRARFDEMVAAYDERRAREQHHDNR
jgi:Spy/CpxP family protein refolding chaperone